MRLPFNAATGLSDRQDTNSGLLKDYERQVSIHTTPRCLEIKYLCHNWCSFPTSKRSPTPLAGGALRLCLPGTRDCPPQCCSRSGKARKTQPFRQSPRRHPASAKVCFPSTLPQLMDIPSIGTEIIVYRQKRNNHPSLEAESAEGRCSGSTERDGTSKPWQRLLTGIHWGGGQGWLATAGGTDGERRHPRWHYWTQTKKPPPPKIPPPPSCSLWQGWTASSGCTATGQSRESNA